MESAADEFCGIFAFWERFSWTLLDDLRPTLKIRVVKRDLSCSVLQAKLKAKQSPRRCLYQHLWYFNSSALSERHFNRSTCRLHAIHFRYLNPVHLRTFFYEWLFFLQPSVYKGDLRLRPAKHVQYDTYETWCMYVWRRRKSPQRWDSFYRSLFFYVFVFKVFV